jgi:NADH:ubiquinone oxidoreductase subunit 3 (subunit A)
LNEIFKNILMLPPITFLIVLAVVLFQVYTLSLLALKSNSIAPGKTKAYACGEDVPCHRANPEFGQFFSFALFFTIMHVVALMMATLPPGKMSGQAVGIDVVYMVGAMIALVILYRR